MLLMSRKWCLATAALLLTGSVAQAGQQLTWKLKEGEKLQYVLHSKSDILVDASGVEFDITTGQTMDMTWTVRKVFDDGSAEVAQSIDRLQLLINSPLTGEFRWDSKEAAKKEENGEEAESDQSGAPGPGGQIADQFVPLLERMIGQEFMMKVSPRGEVTELKLPAQLKEILERDREGEGGGRGSFFAMLMGGGFSEDSIRELIQRSVTLLPAEAAEEGKPWKQEFKMKLGDIGQQASVTSFAYEGIEEQDGKRLAKIATTDEMTIDLKEDSDLDFELEVVAQESKGEILFDIDAGHVVKAEGKAKIELEGYFSGNDIYQERESTTLLMLGTSDDLPAEQEEGRADAGTDSQSETQ